MKRLVLALAALVVGIGLIAPTPAHAAYGNSAGCASPYSMYFHGPYPIGGGLQSWMTVVPDGTTGAPEDWVIDVCDTLRVDSISIQVWLPLQGYWWTAATNYESWRTIGVWGNSVVAAIGGYSCGTYYRTGFTFGDPRIYYTTATARC